MNWKALRAIEFILVAIVAGLAIIFFCFHRMEQWSHQHFETADGVEYSHLVSVPSGETRRRTSWKVDADGTVAFFQTGPLADSRQHGEWFVIRAGKLERRYYWQGEIVTLQEWQRRNGMLHW